ncbi:MAG: hypothetical protein QXL15_02035, partial [Candidatus Korarchaeota archaeon]
MKKTMTIVIAFLMIFSLVPAHKQKNMTPDAREQYYPAQYLYNASDKSRIGISYYDGYSTYEKINATWGIRINFTVPPSDTSWVVFAIEIDHTSALGTPYNIIIRLHNNANGSSITTNHTISPDNYIIYLNLTMKADNTTQLLYFAPGVSVSLSIFCSNTNFQIKRDSNPSNNAEFFNNNTGETNPIAGDPAIKIWLTNSTHKEFRPSILQTFRLPESPLETDNVVFTVKASCNGSGIRGILFVYMINNSPPVRKFMNFENLTQSNDIAYFSVNISETLYYTSFVRYAFRLYDYIGFSHIYPEGALDEWENTILAGALNFTVGDGTAPKFYGPSFYPNP